jgi:hypothetical protein
MSLSTPKPQLRVGRSMNQTFQKPESTSQRNPGAVISNDWVPATQISKMHKAEPVRRAGPLRPQWYLATAKNLFLKTVCSTRSTA